MESKGERKQCAAGLRGRMTRYFSVRPKTDRASWRSIESQPAGFRKQHMIQACTIYVAPSHCLAMADTRSTNQARTAESMRSSHMRSLAGITFAFYPLAKIRNLSGVDEAVPHVCVQRNSIGDVTPQLFS